MMGKDRSFMRYTKTYLEENPEEATSIANEHLVRARKGARIWNRWVATLDEFVKKSNVIDPIICFDHLEILDDISFANFEFPFWTTFNGTVFSSSTHFNHAEFMNLTDLREAQFKKDVSFRRTTFHQAVDVRSTLFKGNAYFIETNFLHDANLALCKFREGAYFQQSQFKNHTNFINSDFTENVIFAKINFGNSTDFSGAKFRMSAEFSDSTFSKSKFSGTEFDASAFFDNTKFSGSVHFYDTRFSGNADFRNTDFKSRSYFLGTLFEAGTTFESSNFSSRCDYHGTRFSGWTNFDRSSFSFGPSFKEVSFSTPPYFNDVEFGQGVDFRGARFLDYSHSDAAPNYRVLKILMKTLSNKNQEAAFYALEQKALRHQEVPKMNWFKKLMSKLYEFTSNYGQSVGRPLFCLGSVTAFFATTYIFCKYPTSKIALYVSLGFPNFTTHFSELTKFTILGIVAPFKVWSDRPGSNYMDDMSPGCELLIQTLSSVQSVCSLALVTLFILAVRRQFKMD